MYYPTKTSAFISLISAGAIALGGVTVASAHISRFEDLSTANGMSGQRSGDQPWNTPDKTPDMTRQIPGKTERRVPWNTSIDSASLGHSGSNQGMQGGRGLPKDDPAHASPRSHIHAGPHKDQ